MTSAEGTGCRYQSREGVAWFRGLGTALLILITGTCSRTPEPPGTDTGDPDLGAESASGPVTGSADQCVVDELERYPLELSGRDIYVDPQVLIPTRAGFLVAGPRTYEWTIRSSGTPVPNVDRILGVIARDGDVTPITRPAEIARVGAVRASAAGAGRWAFLFEELGPSTGDDRESIGLWSATLEPSGWSELRRMPLPEHVDFWFHASSRLVSLDSGARSWTLPLEVPGGRYQVLHYVDDGSTWRFEAVDSSLVEVAEQQPDQLGDVWTAIVGQDPGFDNRRRSIRLRGSFQSDAPAITPYVAEEGDFIRQPRMGTTPAGLALGWLVLDLDGVSTAWSAMLQGGSPTEPVSFESGVIQSSLTVLGNGRPIWIVHRVEPFTSTQALRLHTRSSDGRMELLATFEHPYTGYFAAMAAELDELVLVGPEFNPDPAQPTVRSLVIRLSINCD